MNKADKIAGINNIECEPIIKINDDKFTMNKADKISGINNMECEPIIKINDDIFTVNKADKISGMNNMECEPIIKINDNISNLPDMLHKCDSDNDSQDDDSEYDPDMPELIGRCDSDSESDDNDLEYEMKIPELLPKYESASDDDDSQYEYENDSLFEELTKKLSVVNNEAQKMTSGGIPRRIIFQERTPTLNRLLNVDNVKSIVDTNLIQCSVCNKFERVLCDGPSIGLVMNLVVRCNECDKEEKRMRKK